MHSIVGKSCVPNYPNRLIVLVYTRQLPSIAPEMNEMIKCFFKIVNCKHRKLKIHIRFSGKKVKGQQRHKKVVQKPF